MNEYLVTIYTSAGIKPKRGTMFANNASEVEHFITSRESSDFVGVYDSNLGVEELCFIRKTEITRFTIRLYSNDVYLTENHPAINTSIIMNNDYRSSISTIPVMLDEGAKIPDRAHKFDAGMDLFNGNERVVIPARGSAKIDTGVHIQIPEYCFGLLFSKSGLNVVHDLTSEGIIDTGYTGSMVVKVYNLGDKEYVFEPFDKVSQLILVPCILPTPVVVDHFEETERGDNGFGSSGR